MSTRGLAEIGEAVRTQNNRITNLPIFVVQQKRRIMGMDPEYADNVIWCDREADYSEATSQQAKRLEALYHGGRDTGTWDRYGYVDIWEFVTACFTEQGCKDYLRINGHNLKEPRIYAESGWRNAEWETIRDHLIATGASHEQD